MRNAATEKLAQEFSEDSPRFVALKKQFVALQRSPEQVNQDRKVADKKAADRFAQTQMGRYKLELTFGPDRSQTKPFVGQLQFFESGAYLSGQGDVKIYICPGKHLGRNECSAPIPSDCNQFNIAFCQKCGSRWSSEEIYGEVYGKHDIDNWARLLEIYFERFNRDCDIYIRFSHVGVQAAAAKEQKSSMTGGEVMQGAYDKVDQAIYPLGRIVQDSGGEGVHSLFKAFLRA